MEVKLQHFLFKTYSYYTPTRIVFGVHSSKKLVEEVSKFSPKKVFVVSGKTVRSLGIVDELCKPLEEAGFSVTVFSQVEPEPSIDTARKAVLAVRSEGFDLVIGIGGGSSMDVAKIAAALAKNPGDVSEYVGAYKVKEKRLPLILVPTVFGTGSEVSPAAVVVDGRVKVALWSFNLNADVSIIDPVLSITVPPKTTAASGIDALSHAIESLMSVEANNFTDALALEAIGLVFTYLERAYANGEDIEARYGVALASALAGMAFTNAGLCLPHGIAYTYAVDYKLAHGASCALCLPYVMEYNLPTVPEKLASAALAMGLDVAGFSSKEAAVEAIGAVRELIESLELPTSLSDVGVPKEELPKMVEDLFTNQQRFIARNPRKPTKEDMEKLYEAMWEEL
ncbi:MAG: iron-containing alcohol dehydrogenase [Candidatus Verstraetearchaeota archaeon]|nr:iron-containing alcohol dehydrogenase [Candidatus Verstraetearchaeota archaeon]